MPFWKCYYHIVWATKNREALITPAAEKIIHEAVRSKSNELHCEIQGINGMADHVHVAVSIRPSLSVSDWVKQIKGASSRTMNLAFDNMEPKFRWQDEYGVLTFGEKNLPLVLSYIENQKEHHRTGDLQPYLERTEE
jgi:putative transposase